VSSSYSTKQGKEKCWRYGGLHWKKDCPNPIQTTTSNPSQSSSHYKVYGHDVNHYFTLHLELWQGQSQAINAKKNQGFKKGQKRKGVTNKGLIQAHVNFKSAHYHGNDIHIPISSNDKHSGTSEIQCTSSKESWWIKKHCFTVWILTHVIFVELDFQAHCPHMSSCWIF
jgi:hypothetical protein